jgi:hypothetical protein
MPVAWVKPTVQQKEQIANFPGGPCLNAKQAAMARTQNRDWEGVSISGARGRYQASPTVISLLIHPT